jgi:hypothetical protein
MPFEKGKSGNPKGRPKAGESLTKLMANYLDKEEDGTGLLRKTLLIKKIYEMAMSGNTTCQNMLLDRIEGKPHQAIALSADIRQKEIDMSKLSDEELSALDKLQKKVAIDTVNVDDTTNVAG